MGEKGREISKEESLINDIKKYRRREECASIGFFGSIFGALPATFYTAFSDEMSLERIVGVGLVLVTCISAVVCGDIYKTNMWRREKLEQELKDYRQLNFQA